MNTLPFRARLWWGDVNPPRCGGLDSIALAGHRMINRLTPTQPFGEGLPI
ncbi:MAG: hypothetical protein LBU34_03420 [Planctomycetaceae bacterium]|nr:hypothetical protein [Planctomycetaceae bacterium]